MTKEKDQITESLDNMYQLGLDHAIDIVKMEREKWTGDVAAAAALTNILVTLSDLKK